MVWEIIDAIGSLVSGLGIVFMAYDFWNHRRHEANIVTAIPVRGYHQHGVILQNLSTSPVYQVQMRICGSWDRGKKSVDVVLPKDGQQFKCWANILSGEWYVDGQSPRQQLSKQLYLSRYDENKIDVSPIYSDSSDSVFYVAELVYTDIKGHRWLRKALKDNNLCLGSAKQVATTFLL